MLKSEFREFEVPLPGSAAAWDARRRKIRATLKRLLGALPPRFVPVPKILMRRDRGAYILESFEFDNGAGARVPGYLALPKKRPALRPAVLYHHYHGGEYGNGKEELLKPGPAGVSPAEAFTREGCAVLAIDAYGFGERQAQGPAGDRETGAATEASLFKAFLWEGRTLWGMMVRDDRMALDYLYARPDVDPGRIGAVGMSMGSTRTWWLAALDDRVKAAVAVACLTRYQDLLRRGELRQHGIYYYVPGVLREGLDTEAIAACIAPRALLTLTGDGDEGSPVEGVRRINAFCRQMWKLYGETRRFRGVVYPDTGHVFTKDMWNEMTAWFRKNL